MRFYETFVFSELWDLQRHLYFLNFAIWRDIQFWNGKWKFKKFSWNSICRSERIQMILHKSFDLIVTNLGLSSDFPLLKMPDKDCRACNNCAKPRCDAQLTPLFRYRLAWKIWSYLERNKIKKFKSRFFAKRTNIMIGFTHFVRQIASVIIITFFWNPNFGLMPVSTIFYHQIYMEIRWIICFTQEYRPSHIFFLRGIYDPLRLAIFCKKKIRLVSNSRFSTRR